MGYKPTKQTCPHCGAPLYIDTSTGELVCLNPDCDEDEDWLTAEAITALLTPSFGYSTWLERVLC